MVEQRTWGDGEKGSAIGYFVCRRRGVGDEEWKRRREKVMNSVGENKITKCT